MLFKAKSVMFDKHVNRQPTAAAERPDGVQPPTFWRHKIAGGPGQKIECYHPKTKTPEQHCRDLLTPSPESAQACKVSPLSRTFRCKQKLFNIEVVEVDGAMHGGAHMPLQFQCRHESARSPVAQAERAKKKKTGKKRKVELLRRRTNERDGPGGLQAPPQRAPQQRRPKRCPRLRSHGCPRRPLRCPKRGPLRRHLRRHLRRNLDRREWHTSRV